MAWSAGVRKPFSPKRLCCVGTLSVSWNLSIVTLIPLHICAYLHDSSNYSLMSLSYATALPVGSSNSRVSSTFQTMWSDLSSLDGPDFVQRGFCEQLCQSDDSGLLIFYASSTSFPKNVSLRTFALYQGTSFASFHTQVFLTVSNVWRGFFSVFSDIWGHVGFPWKGINV